MMPTYGTVDWWIERYYRSDAFLKKVSDRSKPDYKKALKRIADMAPSRPPPRITRIGHLPVKSITPAAVDKLYVRLRGGEDGTKYRSANLAIDIAKKAWRVVQRRYPNLFHETNPFEGLERIHPGGEIEPATRDQAYTLAKALNEMGHRHLGAAPLICFEWLQRPENVLAGLTTWPGLSAASAPELGPDRAPQDWQARLASPRRQPGQVLPGNGGLSSGAAEDRHVDCAHARRARQCEALLLQLCP
jgi:hypothetical protein